VIFPGLLGGEPTLGLIGLVLVPIYRRHRRQSLKIFTRPDQADGPG